jgi:cellulose synthase/poly-beta-1,6-N-acetylglucosamine synthase-like glycosyltransferase
VLLFGVYMVYNVPVVVAGLLRLWRSKREKVNHVRRDVGELPVVSIVVAVKNEEKVVGRLLKALSRLDYPSSRREVIMVNDASADRTGTICLDFSRVNSGFRVLERAVSTTKAGALNFGVQHAQGEIVATFDGDSVPEPDALLEAVKYFRDPCVAAVQGRVCSINADQNMLTRFISYESSVQFEVYAGGKDSLNLFVNLAGTCQFIRKADLAAAGGWNEDSLAEDMELSARLVEQGKVIRYASEVRTSEESPFSIRGLLVQRARWFRGIIEVGLKFGRLLRRPSVRRFDAEMTFLAPFVIMLSLANYFAPFLALSVSPTLATVLIVDVIGFCALLILGVVGFGLTCLEKPLRWRNVLWLPFIYAYWFIQGFIVLYAFFEVLLRRKRRWRKTEHLGMVTSAAKEQITAGLLA